MAKYAETTAVSSDRSRAEIERVLARYGAIRGDLMGVVRPESVKCPQKTVEMVKIPRPEATVGQFLSNLAISKRFLQIFSAFS
ncbi:hypothetical protein [Acidithiobacillus sulfuriphilus]|uniref:hypothetical protein n=1 Tax=Acidithiobacillus sulfuriphilus TaxID=1867749 RepID=UPI003F5F0BB5